MSPVLDDRIFEAAMPVLDELDRVAVALAGLPTDISATAAAEVAAAMLSSKIRELRGVR